LLDGADMPQLRAVGGDLFAALCAAELDEPFDFRHAPSRLVCDLVTALPDLRRTVPFAALQLVARLSEHVRADVRAKMAALLPGFAELYREQVHLLLLPLSRDPDVTVQVAAAEVVQELLLGGADVDQLLTFWDPRSI
jgi:hypothetical protein